MGTLVSALIEKHFPNVKNCGHTDRVWTFFAEEADDRYYYLMVERCTGCFFPMGGERDATQQEIKEHYAKASRTNRS